MCPLLNDHWDVMNDDASDALWVAVGKGIAVLVVNEKDAATDVRGIWPAAETWVSVDERKKSVSDRIASMVAGEPVSGGSGLDC